MIFIKRKEEIIENSNVEVSSNKQLMTEDIANNVYKPSRMFDRSDVSSTIESILYDIKDQDLINDSEETKTAILDLITDIDENTRLKSIDNRISAEEIDNVINDIINTLYNILSNSTTYRSSNISDLVSAVKENLENEIIKLPDPEDQQKQDILGTLDDDIEILDRIMYDEDIYTLKSDIARDAVTKLIADLKNQKDTVNNPTTEEII